MNAVFARGRTDDKHRITHPIRRCFGHFTNLHDPRREGVNEGVRIITFVEIDFAAHRRDAKSVAIIADTFGHATQQAAGFGQGEITETE